MDQCFLKSCLYVILLRELNIIRNRELLMVNKQMNNNATILNILK